MAADDPHEDAADMAEVPMSGPAWEAWTAAHPAEADEVAIARRVHLLVAGLRSVPVALPADFETRLLARCRQNTMLLDLLDLGLAKGSRVLLDILEMIFGLLPPGPATRAPRPRVP